MTTGPISQPGEGRADNFYVLRAIEPGLRIDGYPEVTPTGSAPVFSFDDGPPNHLPFTEVAIVDPAISTSGAIMGFDRLSGQFSLTKRRSVFFCAEYDKGSRMGCGIGFFGILITGVVWLVGRMRAKHRSRGKVLVGHIFHKDLVEVEGTDDTVVIHSRKPRSGRPIITIVTFPTSDAAAYVRSNLEAAAAASAGTQPPRPV